MYISAKIYYDGSHFIVIPRENFPVRKRGSSAVSSRIVSVGKNDETAEPKKIISKTAEGERESEKSVVEAEIKRLTKKELFEELYEEYKDLPRKEKREKIIDRMSIGFKSRERAETFVEDNIARKKRNAIVRKVRLCRKVYLQRKWNYFATFTYSDEKHTEETFREYLRNTLKHSVKRKGWKYIGVWERGGKNKRLHFHALMYIPDGTMDGENTEEKYYDTNSKRIRTAYINTYFSEKIGRCDFEPVIAPAELGSCIGYLIKYIGKSGERIAYGGDLPTGVISDVLDEDVLCPIGTDDKKGVLYDRFLCVVDGEIIGEASEKTLSELPKWY